MQIKKKIEKQTKKHNDHGLVYLCLCQWFTSLFQYSSWLDKSHDFTATWVGNNLHAVWNTPLSRWSRDIGPPFNFLLLVCHEIYARKGILISHHKTCWLMSISRLYRLKYLTSIIYYLARSDGISFLGYNLLSLIVSFSNLCFQLNVIFVFHKTWLVKLRLNA